MNDAPSRKRPRRSCVAAASRQQQPDDDNHAATTTTSARALLQQSLRQQLQGQRIIVFSGAGLSVTAGIPTFTGTWYKQAAQQFQLAPPHGGMHVFSYRFLQERPDDYWQFFSRTLYPRMATITTGRRRRRPTPSHDALRVMEQSGQLIRHYTLNVDGLAAKSGMSIWKPEKSVGSGDSDTKEDVKTSLNNNRDSTLPPEGKTVELHGNIHELVCRQCGEVYPVTRQLLRPRSHNDGLPCCPATDCPDGRLRFRVLLYSDKEGHLIYQNGSNNNNNDPLAALLPDDVAACQAILWIGISFGQRASCQYFELVDQMRQKAKKQQQQQQSLHDEQDVVPMYIIDPHPIEALENLMDGLQQQLGPEPGCRVYTVASTSDAILGELASCVQQRHGDSCNVVN